MRDARRIALDALIAFRREGSWPDLYLKKASASLTTEDAALAASLTYGVLEQRALLDFWIDARSSVPVRKMTPPVPDILRIALYQIVNLDRVPDSAAVNEAVKQARACVRNPRTPSFCNAVLRRLASDKHDLPMPQGSAEERLSITYSHPLWFVRRLLSLLGENETESFLRLNNQPSPLSARVNTNKTTFTELSERLGENAEPGRVPNGITLKRLDVTARSALKQGLLYIQDEASQICALTLGAEPGMRIADLCAAPGGKSLLLAQEMKNTGLLLSCDLHEHRTKLIEENARRCGLTNIRVHARDASEPWAEYENSLDAVLCDVPCSGMGVIRKKPDLRYKEEKTCTDLLPLQARILRAAASLVKPGGTLLYSTCTVLPEENEEQVAAFLGEHTEFSLAGFETAGRSCSGELMLWPQRDGTDGFFIAKMRKRI